MPEVSQAWLALIGALLGGAGLKVIESWLNKSKVKEDIATNLRNEIREDLKSCRAELHQVEKDLDAWKERYYDLIQDSLEEYGGIPPKHTLREIDRDNKS